VTRAGCENVTRTSSTARVPAGNEITVRKPTSSPRCEPHSTIRVAAARAPV
jgi:hypothetical protein